MAPLASMEFVNHWALILAGPLAQFKCATPDTPLFFTFLGIAPWLAFCLALILAHPIRPSLGTSILSISGLCLWVFLGAAFVTQAV